MTLDKTFHGSDLASLTAGLWQGSAVLHAPSQPRVEVNHHPQLIPGSSFRGCGRHEPYAGAFTLHSVYVHPKLGRSKLVQLGPGIATRYPARRLLFPLQRAANLVVAETFARRRTDFTPARSSGCSPSCATSRGERAGTMPLLRSPLVQPFPTRLPFGLALFHASDAGGRLRRQQAVSPKPGTPLSSTSYRTDNSFRSYEQRTTRDRLQRRRPHESTPASVRGPATLSQSHCPPRAGGG